jgi:hypothetical protein
MQQQMMMNPMMLQQGMMQGYPMGGYPQPGMMQGYPQQGMPFIAAPAQLAQPASAEALPAGWATARDPASGRAYYIEDATKNTQWEKPGEPTVICQ